MDSLVVSLSKFTFPLNPLAFKPVVTFGENEKARVATEAVFTVANRYARAFHKHCFPPNFIKKMFKKARIATEAVFTVANRYTRAFDRYNFPLVFEKTVFGGQKRHV